MFYERRDAPLQEQRRRLAGLHSALGVLGQRTTDIHAYTHMCVYIYIYIYIYISCICNDNDNNDNINNDNDNNDTITTTTTTTTTNNDDHNQIIIIKLINIINI